MGILEVKTASYSSSTNKAITCRSQSAWEQATTGANQPGGWLQQEPISLGARLQQEPISLGARLQQEPISLGAGYNRSQSAWGQATTGANQPGGRLQQEPISLGQARTGTSQPGDKATMERERVCVA